MILICCTAVAAICMSEAAIEGIQASVDALLLFGGWCLEVEIVISNSIAKYLIVI